MAPPGHDSATLQPYLTRSDTYAVHSSSMASVLLGKDVLALPWRQETTKRCGGGQGQAWHILCSRLPLPLIRRRTIPPGRVRQTPRLETSTPRNVDALYLPEMGLFRPSW
jgi:hypothetical protein